MKTVDPHVIMLDLSAQSTNARAMAYDYDTLYAKTADALGAPTQIFVDFFGALDRKNVRVLDIGCGQGRDAIFIARMGHSVVGVDISPNGIKCLLEAAKAEQLNIEGVVADVRNYNSASMFDIILIDRTLHMLAVDDRLTVLENLLTKVREDGWILIADEASNIPEFEKILADSAAKWHTHHKHRGYLFCQRPPL